VAVIALCIAALAVLALARWTRLGRPTHARSLAVLPLENLSGQSDQEYFADGLTDALITDLSQIHSLRVVSRTSVMGFKQTRRPLPEIASALKADLIVEGSVLRDRDRVRVTAQLIDGATDRHLWARSYERSVSDLLNLQAEVARTIAREIRVTLTPQEEARLTAPRSVNPEAHEAFLMGRYAFNKRTEAGLKQALEYYQRAVEIDPGYAPAHAAIASTYNLMQFYAGFSPSSVFPKAKKAAQKAIELDDSLPQAHAALAYVTAYYDWEWAAAEREFKRAIELVPNDADVYHTYSRYLAATGRVDEALENVRRAQELDPAPLIYKANEAITLYFARRYDRAIEQLRKVAALDPNFYVAYWGLGLCLEQRGDLPGAIAQFEKAVALTKDNPHMLAALGHAYAVAGRRGDALRILERLAALAKQRYFPSYYAASVQVALGDAATSIDLLEQSYAERSTLLAYLKMDPRFDPLRSQPRFQALLSRIGL
jgi:TolB-like protein/Tfp pilus assembly protein PilF